MRHKSITLRLSLLFSATSTTVLLIVGYLIGTSVENHFERQDLDALTGKIELVRHALAKAGSPTDLSDVSSLLDDALIGHDDLTIAVIGTDNRMLFIAPKMIPSNTLTENWSPGDHSLTVWEQGGHTYRGIATSAFLGNSEAFPVTIVAALNIDHHDEFMTAFHKNLWIAIATGILLTAFLGWISARRGLAPVRHMAKISRGISASRLDSRLPLDVVPHELLDLAIAFNDMLARLEESFRRLSDFSSDIAHELRTPISILVTQTQVALARSRSAEEYREILYSSLEEYDRLSRMTSDMLFLARADDGCIVPQSEAVSLAKEVQLLFEFYEAVAEEKQVDMACAGEYIVQGDRMMISRAISNLISNAIRHTPSGETISLHIDQSESGEPRLTVENPGAEIPPEHLPRLFDRYYQIDPSRQRTENGSGLGLAITKSIIEAHRGKILVFSTSISTRFELRFPAI